MSSSLMQTYAPLPVSFVRGEGAWLWDADDRQYLDAVAGVAVCSLGHAHPELARAIADQATTLLHTSNLYQITLQQKLAGKLTRLADMDRVFFANSGAEANEAAIKIARLHGHARGVEVPQIIVAEGSFHGRTLATLTATGNRKVQAGFEPLVQGFLRVPYDDLDAVTTLAAGRSDVVAVMVEPIQGEGGVVSPDPDYLRGLEALCRANDWLLILDEIQTGMARTGRWFCHQHDGVQADVMTLAKALGNGVPIGACLARGAAAELMAPGSHGSTFGGNLLACRAALSVLEIMRNQDMPGQARKMGDYLMKGLSAALSEYPAVVSVRGRGLMIGIELQAPIPGLVAAALDKGVLINVTAERVIRLLPPLILTEQQADRIIAVITDLLDAAAAAED